MNLSIWLSTIEVMAICCNLNFDKMYALLCKFFFNWNHVGVNLWHLESLFLKYQVNIFICFEPISIICIWNRISEKPNTYKWVVWEQLAGSKYRNTHWSAKICLVLVNNFFVLFCLSFQKEKKVFTFNLLYCISF